MHLSVGALTPTTITYDPNGGTGSAVTVDTGKHGNHTFTAQWEKVQEPEDETTPDKTTPSDNTPKGGNGVKTGDTNNIVLFIMLAVVSLKKLLHCEGAFYLLIFTDCRYLLSVSLSVFTVTLSSIDFTSGSSQVIPVSFPSMAIRILKSY